MVTKGLFVNFSVGDIISLANVYLKSFESRSHLAAVTAAQLRRELSNVSVIIYTTV